MNNTALITGGAKRIGNAIAKKLALHGYDIALHFNTSEEKAMSLQKHLQNTGVRCELFKCDLSNEKEVLNLIPEVMKKFNNIDLLINNASIFNRATLIETDINLFNKTFNINFKAPYILTGEYAKLIKTGHIINIIDTKAEKNDFIYSCYTLSKKSLKELTLMSAKELGPDIRVNGIAPGLILEPEGKPPEYLDEMAKNIPLKRKGNVESITNALIFLIENTFITGQILFVDGGQHL